MSNSFGMAIIFLLIISNVVTFILMYKRFRKEKKRAEIEFLRARMWSINYFDLRHVLHEKYNKVLAEAGREYYRRLKEQEERFMKT